MTKCEWQRTHREQVGKELEKIFPNIQWDQYRPNWYSTGVLQLPDGAYIKVTISAHNDESLRG